MDVLETLGPIGGALSTVAAGVLGIVSLRQRAALKEREREASDAQARALRARADVLAQEGENTAQHAILRAQEELAKRLERAEGALDRAQQRADLQEQALDHAREESRRLAWQLQEALAELHTTREYVRELQATNSSQAEQIAGLRGRVSDLERELRATQDREQALAAELHRPWGMPRATPLPPPPKMPRAK